MNATDLLLGALGFSLLLVSAWLCIANAWILLANLRRRPAPSWIPLIGGVLGVLGLLALPFPETRKLWWLPLFLDWGSIPGVTHALVWHLRRPR